MKYGHYEIINNKLCYYETYFNISVILGKLSYCNSMLKEQVDTIKGIKITQRKIISEEHVLKPKLRAKVNEHVPNTAEDNA